MGMEIIRQGVTSMAVKPIEIEPSISPRERVLVFGAQGTGKSNALLTIARKCPQNRFWVVDNDVAYDRLLATEFTDCQSNVEVMNVDATDWEGHLAAITRAQKEMARDDWLVVDMLTATWDSVQDWFTEQIFGQSTDEYFMQVRKKKAEADSNKKALGALDGWLDWPVINKTYRKLQTMLLNTPGHLYATAEIAGLGDDEDRDVRAIFGPYGVKPKGQKRTGHLFQTVLMMTKSRVGDYALTTIKDRGRAELEDVEVNDFARDYLMKVAGWKVVARDGDAD